MAEDWLSRFFEMMTVSGRLDLRCSYGASWRIDQRPGKIGEIPYHAVIAGSAVLDGQAGSPPLGLKAGDILVLPGNPHHVLHDGGGKEPTQAVNRSSYGITISENVGTGERLDMLCGRFVIRQPYDRLLARYLPPRLVVRAGAQGAGSGRSNTAAQLGNLVTWMRSEATGSQIGGVAILNALSAALFTLTMRLASEANDAPAGLLSIAQHSSLAPALTALFGEPARSWSLPELSRLCNMSRATFVRRFQEKLGRSARDLLTEVRMTLAANELRKPSMSTGAVADSVGYQSEAAFQRAFKSYMGVTPAEWRRLQMRTKRNGEGVAAALDGWQAPADQG